MHGLMHTLHNRSGTEKSHRRKKGIDPRGPLQMDLESTCALTGMLVGT
jgi:hypothetical protein